MNSARAQMTQRATVQRNQGAGLDAYNHPVPATWANLYPNSTYPAGMPCWYYSPRGLRVVTDQATHSKEPFNLMVPLGTDITDQDRVTKVTDRLGNVIFGLCQVTHVKPMRRYLDVELLAIDK